MPTFALPAELTAANAMTVRAQALAALCAADGDWAVDCTALDHFDSASLALLMDLRRAAPGQRLRVDHPPQRLRELAQAYGVAFILDNT